MNVIALITTKNRFSFLKQAIESVQNQKYSPKHIIVSSDSDDRIYNLETKLAKKYKFTLIKNYNKLNLASNLNNGIKYIIKNIVDGDNNKLDYYLATLDDDDLWDPSYLSTIKQVVDRNNVDAVFTGLIYKTKNENKLCLPPEYIDINSFLISNPNIQGSNTFVKLRKILEAGCFDESMSATTDRNFFVRLFMLKPTYRIIKKYLVFINAKNRQDRITLRKDIKRDSLIKFYKTYSCLMNDKQKEEYLIWSNKFCLITKTQLEKNKKIFIVKKNINVNNKLDYNVLFSVISNNYNNLNKLLKSIVKYGFNKRILLFWNSFKNINVDYLSKKYNLEIITCKKEEALKIFNEYKLINFFNNGFNYPVNNIPCARTILQFLAYKYSDKKEIIWVLDDDVLLCDIDNNKINIKKILSNKKYDAIIGNLCYEPAIPLLSTIRTQLIDYLYNIHFKKNENFINDFTFDYFYDLSTFNNQLEVPYLTNEIYKLDDIFNHKFITRKLFNDDSYKLNQPKNRGGNTIIFNRDLLLTPNISLEINKTQARRGDYFWVLLNKTRGYKIGAQSFSIKHNRGFNSFNYDKEINKLKNDILGSSLTKTFERIKLNRNNISKFIDMYLVFLEERLTLFIMSYIRSIGILKIINDKKYINDINYNNLFGFINEMKQLNRSQIIKGSIWNLLHKLTKMNWLPIMSQLKKLLEQKIHSKLELLGYGNQGIVFSDKKYIYKIVQCKEVELLKKNIKAFLNNKYIENPDITKLNNYYWYLSYPYYSYKPYDGGHTIEICDFINQLKKNGFVYSDWKKENFIIVNNQLKCIDFSFKKLDEKKWNRYTKRAYQMIEFSKLDKTEYATMITRTISGDNSFEYNYENFLNILNKKQKKHEHDLIVQDLIIKYKPKTLLDYGCGKCEIINSVHAKSKDIKIDGFDINYKLSFKRAIKGITIIKDINGCNSKYDMIISNLVLCVTDLKTTNFILKQFKRLSKPNGDLIISICNPLFDNLNNTIELRQGYNKDYNKCSAYNKKTDWIDRTEYHRSLDWYIRQLSKNDIEVQDIKYDTGANINDLSITSERIIFICKHKQKYKANDCSLLIKTNSMEWKTIYSSIKHIVNQLEKNTHFKKILITVDLEKKDRNRLFDINNLDSLKSKLKLLKINGYIDRIIYVNKKDIKKTYKKYFKNIAKDSHSQNGQNIFSTLYGFECVKTKYVYQTDSDILYMNNTKSSNIKTLIEALENGDYLSISNGINTTYKNIIQCGYRTECRTSIINLEKLNKLLPLENKIINNKYELSWNKCLDKTINNKLIARYTDKNIFFIHPQNDLKSNQWIIPFLQKLYENNNNIICQQKYVNFDMKIPIFIKTKILIYIRGRNTSCSKLLRLFESLKNQIYKDFHILYIDDFSNKIYQDFLEYMIGYNSFFKNKITFIFNSYSVGVLKNLEVFYNIFNVDKNTIIVNVDSDDFINENALMIIKENFDKHKADLSVGNCIRLDKPLKNYQMLSFKNLWERGGDNIWLHPKCFKNELFKKIDIKSVCYLNNKLIYVNTDFMLMCELIKYAKNPIFIKDIIYGFEPSIENIQSTGKYKGKNKIKVQILKQLEEWYEKNKEGV